MNIDSPLFAPRRKEAHGPSSNGYQENVSPPGQMKRKTQLIGLSGSLRTLHRNTSGQRRKWGTTRSPRAFLRPQNKHRHPPRILHIESRSRAKPAAKLEALITKEGRKSEKTKQFVGALQRALGLCRAREQRQRPKTAGLLYRDSERDYLNVAVTLYAAPRYQL